MKQPQIMKNLLFFLLFCAAMTQNVHAQQSATTPSGIDFLVKKSTVDRTLGSEAQDDSDRQVGVLMQQSGPRYSIFALEPKLDLIEEGQVEGTRTQPVVKLLYTFIATNVFTGERVGSFDLKIVGTGADRNQAIRKALLSAKKSQASFDKGLDGLREKIAKQLAEKCPTMVAEARRLDSEQKPEDALAILLGIPASAPCYAEVESFKKEVFQKSQAKNCQNILQKAQIRAAANDFQQALYALAQIDAQAPCFADAKTLAAGFEAKLDEDTRTEYEWLLKFYQTGAEAEAARWQAISIMSLEQLKSSGRCCN